MVGVYAEERVARADGAVLRRDVVGAGVRVDDRLPGATGAHDGTGGGVGKRWGGRAAWDRSPAPLGSGGRRGSRLP